MGRSVRGEGILNTSVTYYLPYGGIIQDPNPEEECLQAQVEVDICNRSVVKSGAYDLFRLFYAMMF